MEIVNLDLSNTNINNYIDIVKDCKEIIIENLYRNGGTLKQENIFELGYDWTNLIIARVNGEIAGFLLVRASDNTHELNNCDNYYYISDIVVKNKYKRQGVATSLLKCIIDCKGEFPVVASVLNDNTASIGLLSQFMTCYGQSSKGKYLRFVDNESYIKLYEEVPQK